MSYPKRLIEVDLPIKRISAHARREKSIRHGHISTLHIWWARRPLAACRAVLCAALWPDPTDPLCPEAFISFARTMMLCWATEHFGLASQESSKRFIRIQHNNELLNGPEEIRGALLDFIADFANWDNSTKPQYLETVRALTQCAHEALGGESGTKPLVVDPFAGGGAIPLEALRVGADVFSSDLNPVAVLLNKVVLEYIPKYRKKLADEVRKWGLWIKEETEKELTEFYPKDPDGSIPIAYLWARTIMCEGPGCGAEVPLMRSLWLAKKGSRSVALRIIPVPKEMLVSFEIIENVASKDVKEGTVKRGSATCPCCGYTTPVASVRVQLKARHGGAADARMLCVVTIRQGVQGRFYRLPTAGDLDAVKKAGEELDRRKKSHRDEMSLVPDEPTPLGGGKGAGRAFSQRYYGMDKFSDLFTLRQALALTTIVRMVNVAESLFSNRLGSEFSHILKEILAIIADKLIDSNSAQIWWMSSGEKTVGTFTRQALQIVWDFAEIPITEGPSRNLGEAVEWILKVIEHISYISPSGNGKAERADAKEHPLPNDLAHCLCTDPPYYDAVPYADLSDFFFVWLKRMIRDNLFYSNILTPKDAECIYDDAKGKDKVYFEETMTSVMKDAHRFMCSNGIGIIVFAHKSTSGWEAMLQGLLNSNWIITGTWPIDTERQVKINTIDRAFLGSSVHIVCRPRKSRGEEDEEAFVGDWRDVLNELPQRIHTWMPRLASEGVVGADAIFACLGPALEIFSRYERVEKANGDTVTLREYLEQVWAAVSKEAIKMIFSGADASGFEEDARLTAMWLWTLSTGTSSADADDETSDDESDDEDSGGKAKKTSGFSLEYDAARKIAQGLGAHMDKMPSLVETKGEIARLLPVTESARYLFGKEQVTTPATPKTKARGEQLTLFDEPRKKGVQLLLFESKQEEIEKTLVHDASKITAGKTALDRVHQAMLLFAHGRGEALKRLLVEGGVGQDGRFWKLAQALSALYPSSSEEKRWVDGLLARKKGLGF